MKLCPCQSGEPYQLCCEPYHQAKSIPPTPEALMRSRYCAYALKDIDYIYQTYAPSTRTKQSKPDIKAWAESVSFINLTIIDAPPVGQDNEFGFVDFIATYIQGDLLAKLQEKSRFIFINDRWFYLDGQITPHQTNKISRNASCPCDSGKKFKRCHG